MFTRKAFEVFHLKYLSMDRLTPAQWWTAFPFRIYWLGALARLLIVLAGRGLGIGLDDMFQYDMLARSLAQGNGYRWYAAEDLPLIQPYLNLDLNSVAYDARGVLTSFRPPLYPVFLAAIYRLYGIDENRYFRARLAQAFLTAFLAPLTWALARRCFPNRERAARAAAWLVAFYPMFLVYPLALATENLFFVLFLAASLILLVVVERLGKFHPDFLAGLAGGVFGLAALTRSIALAPAAIAAWWLWRVTRRQRMLLAFVVGVAVVTLPWMGRNTLLHHRLMGIESNLGYNLYLGYHPQGTGTFQYPQSLDLLPILDDGLRDAIGRQKAWEFIRADPWRVPYLVLRRAGHFFSLEKRALMYFYSNNYFGYIPPFVLGSLMLLFCLPFVVVSLSAFVGLALTRRRPESALLIWLGSAYILPHLFLFAEERFHLALVPLLAIFAAQAWYSGPRALAARWREPGGRSAIVLMGICVLLLLANWGFELYRDADKLVFMFGPQGNQAYFAY